jgi:Mlc titration factor MtfA (ptsG expression regulator)
MARWFRRSPDAEPPAPLDWEVLLRRRVPGWADLDADERARLGSSLLEFAAGTKWESARGFEVTDEMKVVVSAQAALLTLGLGLEWLDDVSSIILHASTILLRGEHAGSIPGTRTNEPVALLGEAHFRGPVLIAWDAARYQAGHPRTGQNVIIHEFAHHLDMAGGMIDGTPPMDDALRERWIDVCTAEYATARGFHTDTVLRDYAATDPGEFFAVATEVFFTRPVALRDAKPALYGVLAEFFRQDPAERADRRAAG